MRCDRQVFACARAAHKKCHLLAKSSSAAQASVEDYIKVALDIETLTAGTFRTTFPIQIWRRTIRDRVRVKLLRATHLSPYSELIGE
jgi:hypothetical protein